MTLSNYISFATLLVTAAGWYFTHRSQRQLQEQQQKYEQEKEARQALATVWSKQLDSIESWLGETIPIAANLMQSPHDAALLSQSHQWQTRVSALYEIARQHDPAFIELPPDQSWPLENSELPSDLPRLVTEIGTTNMSMMTALHADNREAAVSPFIRLFNLNGKAFDALNRVRKHVASHPS